MKISPVDAELFHVGGRRDMWKPMVVFRDFAKIPKNRMIYEGLGARLCLHTHTNKYVDIHHNKGTEGNILSNSVYICM